LDVPTAPGHAVAMSRNGRILIWAGVVVVVVFAFWFLTRVTTLS